MITRLSDREPVTRESPNGKFGVTRRNLFTCPDTGAPFDLDHVTLPPGKRNFPHHAHAQLWEAYYIVSGEAVLRLDDESHTVVSGDSIVCPPGTAHQIVNESDGDVVYLVISNDVTFDACFYPDSGKLLMRRKVWKGQPDDGRVFWTRTDETYWTGEDEG